MMNDDDTSIQQKSVRFEKRKVLWPRDAEELKETSRVWIEVLADSDAIPEV